MAFGRPLKPLNPVSNLKSFIGALQPIQFYSSNFRNWKERDSYAGLLQRPDYFHELFPIDRSALEGSSPRLVQSMPQKTNDPLPGLKADAGKLTQVFQNLIGNALKFSKPGNTRNSHPSLLDTGLCAFTKMCVLRAFFAPF